MVTAHGNIFPLEQLTARTWEPGKGWKANRVYEGPEEQIQAMANNIIATSGRFVRVDVKPKPPGLAQLQISFDGIADNNQPDAASNGEPVADADSFSLSGSDSEKSIWSHSAVTALAASDPDGWQYLRTKVTEAEKDGSWVNIINAWDTSQFANSTTSDDALTIFKALRDGIESYTVSTYILRRTRGISSAAQGQVSVDYVGYTFSNAQLISYEGLPTALNFGLPSTGRWLKRTPSIQFDAVTGKMSVDGEFWWAEEWNSLLYPQR